MDLLELFKAYEIIKAHGCDLTNANSIPMNNSHDGVRMQKEFESYDNSSSIDKTRHTKEVHRTEGAITPQTLK